MRLERRMTLDEIAERLAIPKTTVWYWIEDIEVPTGNEIRSAARTAAQLRAARAHSERAANLRAEAYRFGWDEYDKLIEMAGFRDFVCMYIGEGYKRNRNRVSIANSNPTVMKLANSWFKRLSKALLTYSVQFHADQDPEALFLFWSSTLGFERDRFVLQRKSNSNQLKGRTWRSEHGVLSITVHDTLLRARLQAWIDRTEKSWLDSIELGV